MIGERATPVIQVIGFGSPNGDDQAGWCVIDQLAESQIPSVRLRKATSPHRALDWFGECESVHLVDACPGASDLIRIDIGEDDALDEIAALFDGKSSHDFGVEQAIGLAGALGRKPRHLILWAIPGREFLASHDLSARCLSHVTQCAAQIAEELIATDPR